MGNAHDRLMKLKASGQVALGWNCAFPPIKTQKTGPGSDCHDSRLTVAQIVDVSLYQEERQVWLLPPGRIKGNPQSRTMNA